jgi:peptide/nickel transport system substrate-binding protein
MLDIMRWLARLALMTLGTTVATLAAAHSESVLRIVMTTDIKVIDPIWTPAYPTRNHGYMIYDTLFAMNDKFEIKPQMVERYEISSDYLTYDFTLRDGLLFHDCPCSEVQQALGSVCRRSVWQTLLDHSTKALTAAAT